MVIVYKNAPMIFKDMMNNILGDLKTKRVEIYLEDIITHSKTSEEHTKLLKEVLTWNTETKQENIKTYSKKDMKYV